MVWNFIVLTVGKLKLVDSCNMLKGSLSNLAIHHISNNGDLSIVKQSLKDYSAESQYLLCRTGKQFFPCEYLDRIDKLQETSLPPISESYSSLTDSIISPYDYQHTQTVWNKTGCKTLKDYVSLYLRCGSSSRHISAMEACTLGPIQFRLFIFFNACFICYRSHELQMGYKTWFNFRPQFIPYNQLEYTWWIMFCR